MTGRKFFGGALALLVGIVTTPLAFVLWPIALMAFVYSEIDE